MGTLNEEVMLAMENFEKLNAEQIRQLQTVLTPKLNKYISVVPTAKQTAALLMNSVRELLYGG
jgi:hypothetical protein